jgi:acyl-CoA thioesterase
METLESYFARDRFAEHSGIELLEVTAGKARTRMVIRDIHLNTRKSVHGGAIFTLADFAFAAASNAYGTAAVGLDVTIAYVKAAHSGILYGEAVEISKNPRIGLYSVTVTDETGDVVAAFQGMVYRKKDSIFTSEGAT